MTSSLLIQRNSNDANRSKLKSSFRTTTALRSVSTNSLGSFAEHPDMQQFIKKVDKKFELQKLAFDQ